MIRGAYMCLSAVLLVNTCHYRLVGMEKDNVRYKTFIYCTREITLSYKILFCEVKRKDHAIKRFLALYLGSIYVEYIYIFVHMCTMNLHVSLCEYLFLCLPCYLGSTMTMELCSSPILRFNKEH